MRFITIPNGRKVTLSAYTQAWRRVKATDPDTRIPGWSSFETPAGEILQAMRKGIHDRINRHDPRAGRKTGDDYFYAMRRFSRMVNGNNVIREYDVPRELRQRFAHRIHED